MRFRISSGFSHSRPGLTPGQMPRSLLGRSITSWADGRIVIGGFAGSFGIEQNSISPGDEISFQVWNTQSGLGPAVHQVVAGSAAARILLSFKHDSTSGQAEVSTILWILPPVLHRVVVELNCE